jgi:hypothetical protein
LRQEARLAQGQSNGALKVSKTGATDVGALLTNFLNHPPIEISAPRELAQRMARLTHIIRDTIVTAFEKDIASDWVKVWRKAFSDVLIAGLDQPKNTPQFADMFAQTLAYGIFTARIMAAPNAKFTVAIPPHVRFPVAGDNIVARSHPRFTTNEVPTGTVYINSNQYFDGISLEAWMFEIGSYQVLEKWLKDRQGRQLSYAELTHYQRMVGAVVGTLEVMSALDDLIDF